MIQSLGALFKAATWTGACSIAGAGAGFSPATGVGAGFGAVFGSGPGAGAAAGGAGVRLQPATNITTDNVLAVNPAASQRFNVGSFDI